MQPQRRLENTTTLFLKKREFGFVCPDFSLGMSEDGFLLPRAHKHLLKRSLLERDVATRDLTGRYTLKLHCDGRLVCELPVIVAWATHKSVDGDPFLAVKVREPEKVRKDLKGLTGKHVELALKPRLAPHLLRPTALKA